MQYEPSRGWSVVPLKRLLSGNDSGTWGDDPSGHNDTLVLRSTEQTADGRWCISDPAPRSLDPKERIRKRLREGDLVVTKSSGSPTHIGKTTLVDGSLAKAGYAFGNFMQRLRTKRILLPTFLWYVMQADPVRQQIPLVSTTTTGLANLNGTVLGSLQVSVPPQEEQRAIAEFLDRETAKIDALIEKQNALVRLLRERRTALVIRASSRGVGEQRLRPSTMYWAPLVPQTWAEQPLKHVLENIQSGVWGEDEDGGVNDIPCVRVADFDRPRLRVGNPPTIRKVARADRVKCRLSPGDLLVEKSGGTGINPVGFVVAYDGDVTAVFANFIARLRVKAVHNPRYWLYALYGSYAGGLTWRSVKQTTGIQNLDMSSYLSEVFPIPDRKSQDEVVAHLDLEAAKVDALISKVEQFIMLAKERRGALITAAVTGQIDVSGEAS